MSLPRRPPASPPFPYTTLFRSLHTLRAGGLVAFPTDTFYALGAAALDEAAVARVFAAKRRPPGEPVPVLVAEDRKSTRLNSSHSQTSYADFCLKKKNS